MDSEPVSPDLTSLCRAIAEHAPWPMAALEGPGHIVRYANAAFCQLLGLAPDQLIGKPFAETGAQDDECLLLLERVVRSGKSESRIAEGHTGQPASQAHTALGSYTMWPVGGNERPLAVIVQVTESAQFHDQSVAMNQALVLGAVRQHELTEAADSLNARLHEEMAERRQAENAMRQSEERLRLAAEAAHFGMYDRDLGGAYFHISAEIKQMLGYEPDPPLSHPQVISHMHPDDQAAGVAAFQRACDPASDGQIAVEQRIVPRDGTVRWIASVGRVLFEDGVPKRSIGFWIDITERKRLEQETLEQSQALADLDRRKDEFLAMLSHELRNPLAPISNAVQLLRLQKNEGAVQQQARAIIERQVGQLKHLVDDLLEVSRISTGRVQLRRDQLDLRSIVELAVESTQPLIAQKGHELNVAMPPEPVWLQADAARLEQVLVNLLNNAAKYTEDGGRIDLNVEREVDTLVPMAVLSVRDSGIGISPELLPHVFDLFTQADQSLHRSQGGLGIGLSLVRQLVELHGGTVTASSVLGQGSEFVVQLPLPLPHLAAPSLAATRAALSASLARPAGSACRVLVVDDNVDAAQSLAVLLEMNGHAVELAYDGPTAIEAAIQHRPEVVLLDIGLPGLDGYETAQRIRQQAGLKGIVLVALTGYGRESDRQRSQEAGFDHHLVKPASFDEIEKILRSVAGNG